MRGYTSVPQDGRTRLSICLSVCLLAYFKKHASKFHQIFGTCYSGSILALLTAIQFNVLVAWCYMYLLCMCCVVALR